MEEENQSSPEVIPEATKVTVNENGSDVVQNEVKDDNQDMHIVHTAEEPHEENGEVPNEEMSTASGQTYFGASKVGSILSEEGVIGSRLASTGITADTQSQNDPHRSPVYNPKSSFMSSKSNTSTKLGFGNTTSPSHNPSKLSNFSLQEVQQAAAQKAGLMKSWSVRTFKCTKQILSEKLGRGTRTVDLELEAKVEILRDTKRKYENLLVLTKALASHFSSIVQTQKVLSSAFAELSAKSQELQEEFRFNAETQLVVARNGEKLLSSINFFIAAVTTVCAKSMDDTLQTVSKYDSARLSYDAYKNELEAVKLLPPTPANINKQAIAQGNFDSHKAVYDQLRDDVRIKLQFLDENRVKVMQKNLLMFHNAISAYFAGNQQQLEATLQQFNAKDKNFNSTASFLEQD